MQGELVVKVRAVEVKTGCLVKGAQHLLIGCFHLRCQWRLLGLHVNPIGQRLFLQ